MSGRGGRAEEVEGEAGGSRHTQCMEMHCNFCLKILLFHFSKSVSVCYQSSFHRLLSFQCPYHRRINAIQESKAVLSPQNASARLSNVNLFLALLLLHLVPHHPALVRNHSSPSSGILLIPLLQCLLALGFFQDLYFGTLHPLPPFHVMSTVSFMISLTDSVTNPVKVCKTPGQFSSAGIYCLGFHGLLCVCACM